MHRSFSSIISVYLDAARKVVISQTSIAVFSNYYLL